MTPVFISFLRYTAFALYMTLHCAFAAKVVVFYCYGPGGWSARSRSRAYLSSLSGDKQASKQTGYYCDHPRRDVGTGNG